MDEVERRKRRRMGIFSATIFAILSVQMFYASARSLISFFGILFFWGAAGALSIPPKFQFLTSRISKYEFLCGKTKKICLTRTCDGMVSILTSPVDFELAWRADGVRSLLSHYYLFFHRISDNIMNFHLARILPKRSQMMMSCRLFSKGGAIPTSSTAEVGGVKVIGLPHLSVRLP